MLHCNLFIYRWSAFVCHKTSDLRWSDCAKPMEHLNVANGGLYICAKCSWWWKFFCKTRRQLWNIFLQTSTVRIYRGSGMSSTDTFWSPPDRSDTPLMSERCRKATGPRGQRSSTPGSKCVLRKPWRKSSAATGAITNSEVRKENQQQQKKVSTGHGKFLIVCEWNEHLKI